MSRTGALTELPPDRASFFDPLDETAWRPRSTTATARDVSAPVELDGRLAELVLDALTHVLAETLSGRERLRVPRRPFTGATPLLRLMAKAVRHSARRGGGTAGARRALSRHPALQPADLRAGRRAGLPRPAARAPRRRVQHPAGSRAALPLDAPRLGARGRLRLRGGTPSRRPQPRRRRQRLPADQRGRRVLRVRRAPARCRPRALGPPLLARRPRRLRARRPPRDDPDDRSARPQPSEYRLAVSRRSPRGGRLLLPREPWPVRRLRLDRRARDDGAAADPAASAEPLHRVGRRRRARDRRLGLARRGARAPHRRDRDRRALASAARAAGRRLGVVTTVVLARARPRSPRRVRGPTRSSLELRA